MKGVISMSNTNPTTKRKWTKKHTSIKRKEAIQGYIFILPWLIGLIVFTLGPLLFSFIGSFGYIAIKEPSRRT